MTLNWIAPPAGPHGALGGHRGIVRTSVMLIGKILLMWTHGGSVWMWVVNKCGPRSVGQASWWVEKTSRISSKSILKEISPEYSLED